MRTKDQIIEDMEAEGIKRDRYSAINNEGATDGYNPHEDRLGELIDELMALPDDGPLVTDLAGERAWFNAQGFTGADLQKANKACLSRGYSLSALQTASKKA